MIDGQDAALLPVPEPFCPLPAPVHPKKDELTQGTIEWLAKFGLFGDVEQQSHLTDMKIGEMTARVHPYGQFPAVQIVSDCYGWTYALDDTYCDEQDSSRDPDRLVKFLAKVMRVAEAPTDPIPDEHIYLTALRDLRIRFTQVATPVQIARWVDGLRAYLFCQVEEAAYRSAGVLPSLNDFVTSRISSGAMRMATAMSDIADGYEMPPAEINTPIIRAAIEMCGSIVCWDNDIGSYYKEKLRASDEMNLRDVLAHEHALSPQQALNQAISMRDRAMRRFLQVREHVNANGSSEMRKYVAALGHWIRGYIDWEKTSTRYLRPNCTTTRQGVATQFTDNSPDPLPVPSVQWWWSDLSG